MARVVLLAAVAVASAAAAPLAPAVGSRSTDPANPHLRVVIQERGLQLLSSEVVPLANAALAKLAAEGKLKVNDIGLIVDTHKVGIGKVMVNLSNIVITSLQVADNGTQLALLDPGNGTGVARVGIDLTGLEVAITAEFRWKDVGGIIKASDHGTVDITASRGTCDIDLTLGPNGPKQPAISSTVSLDLPQFDYKFHGKVSWIYNLLGSALHGLIKKDVESAIQKAVLEFTNDKLPAMVDAAPTVVKVGGGKSTVDLGVQVGAFYEHAITPLALSTGVSMTLADAADPTHVTPCNLTALPLPAVAPRAGDAMVQILLSDSLPGCLSWVFYANGLFDVPPTAFGTTSLPWGLILPPLKAKYPDQPVAVALTPTYPPAITSSRDAGLVGSAGFHLNMSVNSSGQLTYTDTLLVEADFGIAVSVQSLPNGANATLVGNVSTLNLTATVVDSAIGPLPDAGLKLFASLLEVTVRGLINKKLEGGIPITPPGGLLRNATVFTEDGYVTVAADFYKLIGAAG